MEHLAHFGIQRDPFRNEPQLDFHFESRSHRDASRRLLRAVQQGKELTLLVGAVGAGKTAILRQLFETVDPDQCEIGLMVLARGVEPEFLRAAIARQIGIEHPASDRAEAIGQIFRRLVEIRDEKRRAVVLMDEAQMLSGADALGELRGLLNLEHEEERLLSLVLVGPPSLDEILAADPGLQGRVEVRVEVEPLGESEVPEYLAHRVRIAGGNPSLFDGVAAAIGERAGRIPRRMNTLADNALFEAFLASRARPTEEDVERAARDLPWAKGSAPPAGEEADGSSRGPIATGRVVDELPPPDPVTPVAPRPAQAASAPASEPAPEPPRASPLDDTLAGAAAELLDPEVEPTILTPGQTSPGAWRRPAPVQDDPPDQLTDVPSEDELDDLFVDLVEEA